MESVSRPERLGKLSVAVGAGLGVVHSTLVGEALLSSLEDLDTADRS